MVSPQMGIQRQKQKHMVLTLCVAFCLETVPADFQHSPVRTRDDIPGDTGAPPDGTTVTDLDGQSAAAQAVEARDDGENVPLHPPSGILPSVERRSAQSGPTRRSAVDGKQQLYRLYPHEEPILKPLTTETAKFWASISEKGECELTCYFDAYATSPTETKYVVCISCPGGYKVAKMCEKRVRGIPVQAYKRELVSSIYKKPGATADLETLKKAKKNHFQGPTTR